jgi:hypothetical protein
LNSNYENAPRTTPKRAILKSIKEPKTTHIKSGGALIFRRGNHLKGCSARRNCSTRERDMRGCSLRKLNLVII